MDQVIAVRVTTSDDKTVYFLTWGRVQDAVDSAPVEDLIKKYANQMGPLSGKVMGVETCRSLSEAAGAPYFFEAFFDLCQARIPSGHVHSLWRRRAAKRMLRGRDIWFLGSQSDRV